MLVTVSTVKDTLPNVQRFVAGNLAGGADHLVVMLDAPRAADQQEVRAFLDGHPAVTCVATDKEWWAGDKPGQLNVRQRINANLVKAVLADRGWAEWLFHIDADEIIQVDRDVLAAVPADRAAVRLAPLEAVSRKHWDADPTWFKTLLDDDDLVLLHTLGVIGKPGNGDYFHGHVEGKSGVRPTADASLTLHKVTGADDKPVDAFSHDSLRVLHYESFSGEDFVRKWTALVGSGAVPKFRPGRGGTAVALGALLGKGLSEEQAAPYLMRIFERTTEDDFETLLDLGLLVEADPRRGTHTPAELATGDRDGLVAALEALRPEPKRRFHPGPTGRDGDAAEEKPARAGRSFLRRS